MEIQGKIIAVMPERGGVSQRGTEWKVQEYVLETQAQYPRKMVFEVFGAERIQRFNIQVGQSVLVAFDIDAREWNGRWFNSIRAYDVRPAESVQFDPVAAPGVAPAPVSAPVQAAAPAAQPAAVANSYVAQPQAPVAGADTAAAADDLPF